MLSGIKAIRSDHSAWKRQKRKTDRNGQLAAISKIVRKSEFNGNLTINLPFSKMDGAADREFAYFFQSFDRLTGFKILSQN